VPCTTILKAPGNPGLSFYIFHKTVISTEHCNPQIESVVTTDPGMSIMRHVDAGYDEAKEFAEKPRARVPITP
jgi:urocanate hydratase